MKLIAFEIREDYGKEYCLALLRIKNYSLFQGSLSIGEYGALFEPPYLQISMGYGRFFSFLLCLGKLGISFDIAGRNWRVI